LKYGAPHADTVQTEIDETEHFTQSSRPTATVSIGYMLNAQAELGS